MRPLATHQSRFVSVADGMADKALTESPVTDSYPHTMPSPWGPNPADYGE